MNYSPTFSCVTYTLVSTGKSGSGRGFSVAVAVTARYHLVYSEYSTETESGQCRSLVVTVAL